MRLTWTSRQLSVYSRSRGAPDRFARGRSLALAIVLIATARLAAAGPNPTVVTDPAGDLLVRRTDPGANGQLGLAQHRLPDIVSYALGKWQPTNPQADLFAGQWSTAGGFLRFDLQLAGVINPPGPLGCCSDPTYDPFRYGPNPLNGFVEFDVDSDTDTGGEVDAPQLRFNGNVARYAGRPKDNRFKNRLAMTAADFDGNLSTPPLVERSGEDFHLAFLGWEIQQAGIERSDPSDWLFGPGETWIVPGYLFQRSHAYAKFSSACCRAGVPVGRYDPLVRVRFAHDLATDRTTVTLVYPLTQAASAAMRGELPQMMNIFFTDQNSIQEALFELKISAMDALPLDRSDPQFKLLERWENKNPDHFLDPTDWEVTILVGGNYVTQEPDAPFVWSDIYPNVVAGDSDGNARVTGHDRVLFDDFVAASDGVAGKDSDGVKNGRVVLPNFGPNFCMYDLNYDGIVDHIDRQLVWPHPPFAGADFDQDSDVDQVDYGRLQACITGPSAGPPAAGCEDMDQDVDGDVDQDDVAWFQACQGGPKVPVDPLCGAYPGNGP